MTEFGIIESISKKLNSPTGQTLTEEEAHVMEQLRQKISDSDSPNLRELEQFFANSAIVEDKKE